MAKKIDRAGRVPLNYISLAEMVQPSSRIVFPSLGATVGCH